MSFGCRLLVFIVVLVFSQVSGDIEKGLEGVEGGVMAPVGTAVSEWGVSFGVGWFFIVISVLWQDSGDIGKGLEGLQGVVTAPVRVMVSD